MSEQKLLSKWKKYQQKAQDVERETRILLECGSWRFHWMADQIDKDRQSFGIAFALGTGAAHIDYDDMDKDIKVLALDCAEQILGFAVNSEQDKQRKRKWYKEGISASKIRIEHERVTLLGLEARLKLVDDKDRK